jgi:hypothetical protein
MGTQHIVVERIEARRLYLEYRQHRHYAEAIAIGFLGHALRSLWLRGNALEAEQPQALVAGASTT